MRRVWITCLLLAGLAPAASAQVTLMDVIPAADTNEELGNPEPAITFSPVAPRTMVISSFLRADTGSTLGGLFVTFDGGITWVRRNVIPTCSGCWNVNDITVSFNSSGRLLAATLSMVDGAMKLLSTSDATVTTPMVELGSIAGRDQPYIEGRTVFGWYDPGAERAYVGNNHLAGTANAKVSQTLSAAASPVSFTTESVDGRTPAV